MHGSNAAEHQVIYAILWINTLLLVSVKAFQQLNVFKGLIWLIIPTSYFFAGFEIVLISAVVKNEFTGIDAIYNPVFWYTVASMGTGAWMGAVLSVHIHRRIG